MMIRASLLHDIYLQYFNVGRALSTTSLACMPRFTGPPSDQNDLAAKQNVTVSVPSSQTNSNKQKTHQQRFNNSLRSEDKSDSSRFVMKGKSDRYFDDHQDLESMFEHQEDLNLYARDKNLFKAKIVEEDMKKSQKIKLGIIRKKMKLIEGHKHVNTNLLTWDAKEQIKYLNLNYPEEWTVERIVESFPIDEASCRKLLKSHWAPRTLEELIKHDEKVIRNWAQLADHEERENGPALNIYKEYKEKNRLSLLRHATGIPGIEFERSNIINNEYSIHKAMLVEPGEFSGIVNKDDKVKMLLCENATEIAIEEKEKSQREIQQGLRLKTKKELSKSLSKLMMEMSSTSDYETKQE